MITVKHLCQVTTKYIYGDTCLHSRQVTLADQVGDGQWSEELVDPDGRIGRLAALMAHFQAQQSKGPPQLHHKVNNIIILDAWLLLSPFFISVYDYVIRLI